MYRGGFVSVCTGERGELMYRGGFVSVCTSTEGIWFMYRGGERDWHCTMSCTGHVPRGIDSDVPWGGADSPQPNINNHMMLQLNANFSYPKFSGTDFRLPFCREDSGNTIIIINMKSPALHHRTLLPSKQDIDAICNLLLPVNSRLTRLAFRRCGALEQCSFIELSSDTRI